MNLKNMKNLLIIIISLVILLLVLLLLNRFFDKSYYKVSSRIKNINDVKKDYNYDDFSVDEKINTNKQIN